jgi:hypothetical protein
MDLLLIGQDLQRLTFDGEFYNGVASYPLEGGFI